MQPLVQFFKATAHDPRICITHIGVYAALLDYWAEHQYVSPLVVYCSDITALARIDADTYYKRIKELHEYGYLRYEPSLKRNKGSRIYLITSEKI